MSPIIDKIQQSDENKGSKSEKIKPFLDVLYPEIACFLPPKKLESFMSELKVQGTLPDYRQLRVYLDREQGSKNELANYNEARYTLSPDFWHWAYRTKGGHRFNESMQLRLEDGVRSELEKHSSYFELDRFEDYIALGDFESVLFVLKIAGSHGLPDQTKSGIIKILASDSFIKKINFASREIIPGAQETQEESASSNNLTGDFRKNFNEKNKALGKDAWPFYLQELASSTERIFNTITEEKVKNEVLGDYDSAIKTFAHASGYEADSLSKKSSMEELGSAYLNSKAWNGIKAPFLEKSESAAEEQLDSRNTNPEAVMGLVSSGDPKELMLGLRLARGLSENSRILALGQLASSLEGGLGGIIGKLTERESPFAPATFANELCLEVHKLASSFSQVQFLRLSGQFYGVLIQKIISDPALPFTYELSYKKPLSDAQQYYSESSEIRSNFHWGWFENRNGYFPEDDESQVKKYHFNERPQYFEIDALKESFEKISDLPIAQAREAFHSLLEFNPQIIHEDDIDRKNGFWAIRVLEKICDKDFAGELLALFGRGSEDTKTAVLYLVKSAHVYEKQAIVDSFYSEKFNSILSGTPAELHDANVLAREISVEQNLGMIPVSKKGANIFKTHLDLGAYNQDGYHIQRSLENGGVGIFDEKDALVATFQLPEPLTEKEISIEAQEVTVESIIPSERIDSNNVDGVRERFDLFRREYKTYFNRGFFARTGLKYSESGLYEQFRLFLYNYDQTAQGNPDKAGENLENLRDDSPLDFGRMAPAIRKELEDVFDTKLFAGPSPDYPLFDIYFNYDMTRLMVSESSSEDLHLDVKSEEIRRKLKGLLGQVRQDINKKIQIKFEQFINKSREARGNPSTEELKNFVDNLHDMGGELNVFATAFKILSSQGEIDLKEFGKITMENHSGPHIPNDEKEEMLKIASENWAANKEYHDVVLAGMAEAMTRESSRFYILYYSGKIIGFVRFDDLGEGRVYAGSFNIKTEVRGHQIGEALSKSLVDQKAKQAKLVATADPRIPIATRYIGDFGFVATGFEENYLDKGETFFKIERSDENNKKYAYLNKPTKAILGEFESGRSEGAAIIKKYDFSTQYQEFLAEAREKTAAGYVITAYRRFPESKDYLVVYEKKSEGGLGGDPGIVE